MKIEDLLKFGKLFLDSGMWKGKRLVSEKWLTDASEKQIDSSPAMNDYGYGYHIWRSIRKGSYQFNGMLGQNLIIFPDIRMVIATYCGNAEFFPKSDYVSLIGKYFGDGFMPTVPLRPSRRFAALLSKEQKTLSLPPIHRRFERNKRLGAFAPIIGKHYAIEGKNATLLPVTLCVMHNNFPDEIKNIAFRLDGTTITAVFEKEKETISVPFGSDGTAAYFDLTENGETFSAAAIGYMTKNEDDIPVLKLSIYYLETTSVRHIKFFFRSRKISVRFTEEAGGAELLEGFRPMIDEVVSKNKALKFLMPKADGGLLEYNLEKLFSPEYTATEIELNSPQH